MDSDAVVTEHVLEMTEDTVPGEVIGVTISPELVATAVLVFIALDVFKRAEGALLQRWGLAPHAIVGKFLGPALALFGAYVATGTPTEAFLVAGIAALAVDQGQSITKWWPVLSRLVAASRSKS